MAMSEIKLEIGEGQIQNAIAVALAESFSPENKASIIRDVVRAHLNHKENTYDKETILSKVVGKHVRDVAMVQVKERLDEMKPDIQKIVKDSLGKQFSESVFMQLRQALSRVVVSGISLNVNLEEHD